MRTVIGVMGSGESSDPDLARQAREIGRAIAKEGWVLLNGGRATGVMGASAEGARSAGGFVIGILPDEHGHAASKHLDVAIRTGIGSARNNINVLSSDVVIVLKGDAGTLSEVALALKAGRTVVAFDFELGGPFARYERAGRLLHAATVEEVVALVRQSLGKHPAV